MSTFSEKSLKEFSDALASSDSVPGGGGGAGMTGAMGAALGCMVCRLTIGKPKYAGVETDIKSALEKLETLRSRMLALIDEDAAGFKPLTKAWSLPKDDPHKKEKIEAALRTACDVPTATIEAALQAICILEKLASIGVKSAISDIGVGVELCKAAVFASKQNIFINAALMKDEACAQALRQKYTDAEAQCIKTSEKALCKVAERIG